MSIPYKSAIPISISGPSSSQTDVDPGKTIVRERLHALLDEPATVVFVTAAAGFGKTTMLATWARQRASAAGWLSVTPNDNNPDRLADHLARAFTSEPTRLGPRPLRASEAPTLILDDAHLLTDPQCIAILHDTIAALSPEAKLVISGRTPPPLRLARLRSLGKARDITRSDLRFILPEAYDLLGSRASDDGSSRELIRTLWSITLGWPAGLALAANLGIERTRFPPERNDFDWVAWDQALDAYFEEEVIAPLPADLQHALYDTADLPFLSTETCRKPGGSSTPIPFARLAAETGFLEESDTPRERYYHDALFASVLRRLAARRSPAPKQGRHAIVDWLMANNELQAATDLALQSGDPDLIERVFQSFGRWLANRGMFNEMRLWLRQVPAPVMERNPDLQYWLMWGNIGAARTNENTVPSATLQQALIASGRPTDHGRLALLHGIHAHLRDDHLEAVHQLTQALDLLPPEELADRMYAATFLSKRAVLEGRDDVALTMRELAYKLADQMPNGERWRNRVIDLDRADTYAVRGDLTSAITAYRLTLSRSAESDPDLDVVIHARLIAIHLELGQLNEAKAHLERIDELLELDLLQPRHDPSGASTRLLLADRERGHVIGWRRYAAHARIKMMLATGDTDAAGEWFHRYIGQARQFPERLIILLHLAYHCLERGELSLVDDVLSENQSGLVPWSPVFGDINPEILAIDLHLARGEYGQAATRARSLAAATAVTKRRADQTKALMRLAAASYTLGDETGALAFLSQALDIADVHGFVQSLEVPGNDLQPLLRRAREQSHSLRERLSRRPHLFEPSANDKPEVTRRELEILRLVANGKTNKQIAETLFVSQNTVRNHLVRIYQRLNAQTRTEAVAIARARGLLD